MSKVKTFVKFATTFAAGASGGFLAATNSMQDYLIQPPTFANLEPRPIPKPYDFEWGPVVTWDYNWDLRHYYEEDQKTPTATRNIPNFCSFLKKKSSNSLLKLTFPFKISVSKK